MSRTAASDHHTVVPSFPRLPLEHLAFKHSQEPTKFKGVVQQNRPNTVSGTRGSIGPSGSSQNTTAAMDANTPANSKTKLNTGIEILRQASRFSLRRYSASNP